LRCLGQYQSNHAVAHLGPYFILIDPARDPKDSAVGTDVIFAVDWLEALIFAEIDFALDREHPILDAHVDVVSVQLPASQGLP
jgi:hypothetical protein